MANFSINGVGFPSPVAAVKASSPTVVYQPLSSSFSTVSQFPPPRFVQAHHNGLPTTIALPGTLVHSSSDSSMPQSALSVGGFVAPNLIEDLDSTMHTQPTDFKAMWQHNIPSQMPWADGNHKRDLTQFTASTVAAINASETRYAAPCFSPTKLLRAARRQKRKSNGYSSDCPPDKILVNEDRMSEKMRGLQLQGSSQCRDRGEIQTTKQQQDEEWFSTVEDDGLVEDEETGEQIFVGRGQRSTSTELRLQLSKELEKGFKSNDSLKKLIQDELNKSQMQVVLWKPPGGQVRELVNKMGKTSQESQCTRTDMPEEGRCEADGMAAAGRGQPDGAAMLGSVEFKSSQSDPVLSSEFRNSPHFSQDSRTWNAFSPDRQREQILQPGFLNSSNPLEQQQRQQCNDFTGGAFNFPATSQQNWFKNPPVLRREVFTFTDSHAANHLKLPSGGEFMSEDPAACSTPRDFVLSASMTGMSGKPSQTNCAGSMSVVEDDMDL